MTLQIAIRPARPEECPQLTQLCLRAKAHHGYDAAFMAACRNELTVRPDGLVPGCHGVAEVSGERIGFVRILPGSGAATLEDLFIEPEWIGKGAGSRLLDHACTLARGLGACALIIDADPHAEAFYERKGGVRIGQVASGSIPGRRLAQFRLPL